MLPVPPAKMQIAIDNKNKTLNLINEGEINIIKTPGLSDISFEALLPNQYYPFSNYDTSVSDSFKTAVTGSSYNYKKATYFLDLFEQKKNSKSPCRLIITRMTPSFNMLFNTNLLVTLENYSINEAVTEGFDVIVPLRFKQYRPYSTKELEVTTEKDGTKKATVKNQRQTDLAIPKQWEITKEQSIWEACKRASGGNLDWRSVANLNNISSPIDPRKGVVLNLGRI